MKTFKYILLLISVSLLYAIAQKMKMTFTKKNVTAYYLPRK